MEQNSIQVELSWHPRFPLLSVGAYSEERGGYVRVIDTSLGGGLGLEEALPIPPHPTAQVSALAWHPIYKLLIGKFNNLIAVIDAFVEYLRILFKKLIQLLPREGAGRGNLYSICLNTV